MKIGRKLGKENVGFKETVKKYAYLPTIMTNGDLIWFEYYTETRVWESYKNEFHEYMDSCKGGRQYFGYGWNIIKRERA